MSFSKMTRSATLLLGAILGGSIFATGAHALTILTFGQVSDGNTITGADTGGTSTTITSTDAQISITQIDSTGALPLPAYFDLNLTSVGNASNISGSILQHFSGTFSITSGAGDTGTNYLSGSLIDVAFGTGTAFTLTASTPPSGAVTFTSSVITDLDLDRGASLSFVNVGPALSIDTSSSGTINSFSGSVSGNFSAQPSPVPEPATLALLGAGVTGLGALRRRRAR